jgi:hypothetical protein
MLLDTVRSGRSSYFGPRVVPRSALTDFVVAAGIGGQVAPGEIDRCFSPVGPVEASCRFFEDKILVTPFAPIMNPSSPTQASLDLALSWGLVPQHTIPNVTSPTQRNGRLWVMNAYRLTLTRQGSSWHVVDARLTGRS